MSSITSRILKSGGTHEIIHSNEMSKIGLPQLDKSPKETFEKYMSRCVDKSKYKIFDGVDGVYTLVGYAFRKVLSVTDSYDGKVWYSDSTTSPEMFEYRIVHLSARENNEA